MRKILNTLIILIGINSSCFSQMSFISNGRYCTSNGSQIIFESLKDSEIIATRRVADGSGANKSIFYNLSDLKSFNSGDTTYYRITGNDYWIIPFNSGERPVKLVMGDLMGLYCLCLDYDHPQNGNCSKSDDGITVICVGSSPPCEGCCDIRREVHLTPSSGGAILVKARKVKVQDYYSAAIAVDGKATAKSLILTYDNSDTVTYKILETVYDKSIKNGLFNLTEIIPEFRQTEWRFTIPHTGDYWLIPIDENESPFIAVNDECWILHCSCTGDCHPDSQGTMCDGSLQNPCADCCNSSFTRCPAVIITFSGSGFLVKTKSLKPSK